MALLGVTKTEKKIFVIRTVSLRLKNWACLQFGKYYTISPKPIVNPKTPIEILHRTNTLSEGPMTPIELYNSNFKFLFFKTVPWKDG